MNINVENTTSKRNHEEKVSDHSTNKISFSENFKEKNNRLNNFKPKNETTPKNESNSKLTSENICKPATCCDQNEYFIDSKLETMSNYIYQIPVFKWNLVNHQLT